MLISEVATFKCDKRKLDESPELNQKNEPNSPATKHKCQLINSMVKLIRTFIVNIIKTSHFANKIASCCKNLAGP